MVVIKEDSLLDLQVLIQNQNHLISNIQVKMGGDSGMPVLRAQKLVCMIEVE